MKLLCFKVRGRLFDYCSCVFLLFMAAIFMPTQKENTFFFFFWKTSHFKMLKWTFVYRFSSHLFHYCNMLIYISLEFKNLAYICIKKSRALKQEHGFDCVFKSDLGSCCIPFVLGSRNFRVQLESPLESEFLLGKSKNPHYPWAGIERWLLGL